MFAALMLAFVFSYLIFKTHRSRMIEFGFGSILDSARQRSRAHPVVAVIGVLLLGGLVGSALGVYYGVRRQLIRS